MRILALLAAVALSGCVSSAHPDYHVRIDSSFEEDGQTRGAYGHGILVDSEHVLTVFHVAPGKRKYLISRAHYHEHHPGRLRYVEATFMGSFNNGASIERLSVLKLSRPMMCDEFPELRGIEPGDSGSPIVGKRGAVIGLVTGYTERAFWPGRTILGTNGNMGPIPEKFREDEE